MIFDKIQVEKQKIYIKYTKNDQITADYNYILHNIVVFLFLEVANQL